MDAGLEEQSRVELLGRLRGQLGALSVSELRMLHAAVLYESVYMADERYQPKKVAAVQGLIVKSVQLELIQAKQLRPCTRQSV